MIVCNNILQIELFQLGSALEYLLRFFGLPRRFTLALHLYHHSLIIDAFAEAV